MNEVNEVNEANEVNEVNVILQDEIFTVFTVLNHLSVPRRIPRSRIRSLQVSQQHSHGQRHSVTKRLRCR